MAIPRSFVSVAIVFDAEINHAIADNILHIAICPRLTSCTTVLRQGSVSILEKF